MAGLTAGALTLVSCTPTQQTYGLGGAAAGGVAAVIAGGDSGDVARTAAITGAVGTGYAIWKEKQNQKSVRWLHRYGKKSLKTNQLQKAPKSLVLPLARA